MISWAARAASRSLEVRKRDVAFGLVLAIAWMMWGAIAAQAQTTTPSAPADPGTATVQLVLVCGPAAADAPPSTVCPNDANGNPQTPTVSQGYIMTSADYSALQAAIAPFDYTFAGSCFGIGMGMVLCAYVFAAPVGVLARMLASAN